MSRKRFFAAIFALLVGLSLGSTRLTGQTPTTGDIAGVVTDPSGASIPDAKVELKDIAKGNKQETTTNRDGQYHFYLLSPGPITLTISATDSDAQPPSGHCRGASHDTERATYFRRSEHERHGYRGGSPATNRQW